MPRILSVRCADCGQPMQTELPQGIARCNSCRRANPTHGTGVTYKRYKCRCDECKAWSTADARAYRARRKSKGKPLPKRKKKWAGKVQTCEQCGVEFRREARGRFCSPACNGIAQRKVYSTELVHVGPAIPKDAPPTPVTVVTLPKWWGVIIQGPCGWCGEAFTATSGSARYCSDRCSKSAGLARRGKFKIAPRIRRAIYERDNFTCQLCMEPVDLDADPWSDWYPSLDHVIPQSHVLIPDHSLANLRTAHRWCNAVRGDGTWHADFFEGVA